MKRLLLFLCVLLSAREANAQFIIGWNAGYAPTRELNREIYVYNAINRHGLTKEMNEIHWFQGPVIGYRVQGDDGFVELCYNRKRSKVGAEFDSAGVGMSREMKTLVNTWNFGFGVGDENWTIGASFDFGRYKGFGRRGAQSGIGDQPWERLWTIDNTRLYVISVRLIMSETIFIERHFGFMNLRVFAQFPGITSELDGLDYWLFGADLNYGMTQRQKIFNVGAMLTLSIGRN